MGFRKLWGPRESVVVVALAVSVAQAVAEASGETIGEGEAWARVGDAVAVVWAAHLDAERRHRKKGKRKGEKGTPEPAHLGFCQIPKCSRPACHRHHIRWRSRGGGDEEENILAVCMVHHLRAIHDGFLRVEGERGTEVVVTFPGESREAKEVWTTDGTGDERRVI